MNCIPKPQLDDSKANKPNLGYGTALTDNELEYLKNCLGKKIKVNVDYWDSYDEDSFGPQYCSYEQEDIVLEGLLIREENNCIYLFNVTGHKDEAMTKEFAGRIKKNEFSNYFILGARQYCEIRSKFKNEQDIGSLDFCIPAIYLRPNAVFNPAGISKIEDDNGSMIYSAKVEALWEPENSSLAGPNFDIAVRRHINNFLNIAYEKK